MSLPYDVCSKQQIPSLRIEIIDAINGFAAERGMTVLEEGNRSDGLTAFKNSGQSRYSGL